MDKLKEQGGTTYGTGGGKRLEDDENWEYNTKMKLAEPPKEIDPMAPPLGVGTFATVRRCVRREDRGPERAAHALVAVVLDVDRAVRAHGHHEC